MSDIRLHCENNESMATNHEVLPLVIRYEIWYGCQPNDKGGLGYALIARVSRVVIHCKGP